MGANSICVDSYLELVEFALRGKTPQEVLAFRPSSQQQNRIAELVQKERQGGLSEDERAELDTAEQLEHLVVLMKAKASSQLSA